MRSEEAPPELDEIEVYFVGVLNGRIGREAADRWASRWLTDDVETDHVDLDELRFWALELLSGIDLTHGGPDDDHLHDDEQIQSWLDELRRRRQRVAEEGAPHLIHVPD